MTPLKNSENEADCQLAAAILRELISGSAFPHVNRHSKLEEPPVLIACTERPADESRCPTQGIVVTITRDAMHGWCHEQLDRGPLPLHRWRIDGLFGFMTQIIWPRFVSDRSSSRLMALENPPLGCRPTFYKYEQLNNEARQLKRIAIYEYLDERELPLHRRVYDAIRLHDWQSLLKFEGSGELASTGITREQMEFAIPLLKSPSKETTKRGAVGLTGMLLLPIVQRDAAEGRFGGIPVSSELRHVEEQQSECLRAISVAAKEYYAEAFLILATSVDLVEQEESLLHAYRWGTRTTQSYLSRLQAWHTEQLSSRIKPATPT